MTSNLDLLVKQKQLTGIIFTNEFPSRSHITCSQFFVMIYYLGCGSRLLLLILSITSQLVCKFLQNVFWLVGDLSFSAYCSTGKFFFNDLRQVYIIDVGSINILTLWSRSLAGLEWILDIGRDILYFCHYSLPQIRTILSLWLKNTPYRER